MSANQHGFMRRRSCLSNLLCVLEGITRQLDDRENVGVCYLDFSKAFDSVNHRFLLHKLQQYQVSQELQAWIADFLTRRTFRSKSAGSSRERS